MMQIRSNISKKPQAAPPPVVQVTPPTTPRRTKSRVWLLVIFALVGIGGWWTWDHFLRTAGHAMVMLNEVHISAPLAGLIESMRVVKDGDYAAGTVAFTVVDRDSRDELEALQLQLRLVESQMVERTLNLKLSQADRLYERDALVAQRRAALEEALFDQARLNAEIASIAAQLPSKQFDLARLEGLVVSGAASEQEVISARADCLAMSSKRDGLIAAQEAASARIAALHGAVDRPVPETPDVDVGIEPLRRQAELARRRIEQLQERLLQSQVRLPIPGKVVRILRQPGEFVQTGEQVLVVAQPGTLHVVAYFHQADISEVRVNDVVRIVSSYAPELAGRVARLGPGLESTPDSIARFFARGEPTYPVEIELAPAALKHLVPGSVVRVIPATGGHSTVQNAWARPRTSP